MAPIPRLIDLGAKPVRVVIASGYSTLVVNRGTATAWLTPDDGLSVFSTEVAVLDPGGTILLDGDFDWWGITPDGSAGLVNSIPGASAQTWSAQSIADAIANEGGLVGSAVWEPADDGLLIAAEDPWASIEQAGMLQSQNGQVLLQRAIVRTAVPRVSTVTLLYIPGTWDTENIFFGLYNAAGQQLLETGDFSAQLGAADTSQLSPVEIAFTASGSIPAGLIWGALLQTNGNVGSASFWGSGLNGGSALSPALSPATARTGFVGNPGDFTALPASFTPGTDITIPTDADTTATPVWFGLK